MVSHEVQSSGQLFFDVAVEGLYEAKSVPVTQAVTPESVTPEPVTPESVTPEPVTPESVTSVPVIPVPPAAKPEPLTGPCGAEVEGFRGPVACSAAAITYRQLDYWARTGLVTPSIRSAAGSGSTRLYSFRDILALQVVKRLLDSGVSLANIRIAIATVSQLQDCQLGGRDLSELTLISDGSTVYLCTNASEVIDLLRGGQAVFGIAVGQVWSDVQATLAPLPRERADAADNQIPRPRLRIVS